MYKIERIRVGTTPVYKLTFSGFMKKDEMDQWVEESKQVLKTAPPRFCVWVDMCGLKPLPKDAQAAMESGQAMYKHKGMERSAVLLDSKLIQLQFQRLAKESGIDEWERYFTKDDDTHEAAIAAWVTKAA